MKCSFDEVVDCRPIALPVLGLRRHALAANAGVVRLLRPLVDPRPPASLRRERVTSSRLALLLSGRQFLLSPNSRVIRALL